ncbi:MAG: 1-(5-phosphoribosyl)-5-[(5-phosphoribosylamino)methylideneamino]imidazole-4-carboxamide isomerase [Planctomycetota bacterium]|jgi:phosphoribosylformimino-5-aminoimidazole carboxamide ribotide isomerase
MDVLPSIDLRGGKVVRLAQGDYDRQTVYGDDPAGVARQFVEAGARWIHVVDLDAALTGQRRNAEAIESVCRSVDARVELGGGIRDDDAAAAALSLGVARVIVGSAALADWAWFESLTRRAEMAGKVVLGLDARGGELAIRGWTERAGLTVAEIAARAHPLPLAAIIHTDIERDGMLTGPNVEAAVDVKRRSGHPVIASGGVGGIEDVAACKRAGCDGVIVGRAWYEGRIDLAEACRLAAG